MELESTPIRPLGQSAFQHEIPRAGRALERTFYIGTHTLLRIRTCSGLLLCALPGLHSALLSVGCTKPCPHPRTECKTHTLASPRGVTHNLPHTHTHTYIRSRTEMSHVCHWSHVCAYLTRPRGPKPLTPVGFEPTQLALVELESTPLGHSGKVSFSKGNLELAEHVNTLFT